MACHLLAVEPPSPGIAPPGTGTSGVTMVLPIDYPLLTAAHPLFTVSRLSSSLERLRSNPYHSPIKGKK